MNAVASKHSKTNKFTEIFQKFLKAVTFTELRELPRLITNVTKVAEILCRRIQQTNEEKNTWTTE